MELKNFNDFIAEAKDSQKSKVNNDMHSKDATHGEKPQVLDTKVKADGNNYEGDKPDILDTSINEADAQKEKENSDLKAKDASHGEKAQVIKEEGEDDEKVIYGEKDDDEDDEKDDDEDDEKDLKESFDINKNLDKNWGDELDGVDGFALKSVSKNSFAVAYKDKNAIILKTDKAEIRLDGSMIDQLSRLLKRR